VETLRAERDELRRILSFGPADPRPALRRVSEELADRRSQRDDAAHRADEERQAIEGLGLVGGRIHRPEVEEHQIQAANATRWRERMDARINELVADGDRLGGDLLRWRRWQEKHADDIDRLRVVARHVASAEAALATQRVPEQTADLGLDLGLGL